MHQTPLQHSTTFSAMTGTEIYMKLESLQKTGAFKLRGAYNKIALLPEAERRLGVVTASAGNHAQGVACAASAFGVPATVFMPVSAPQSKRLATENYGSQVMLVGSNYDEAYAAARSYAKETGAAFVHAFDDPDVIAGQGTIGLDIMDELPDAETIVVPIGGGGLISGVALAAKTINPSIRIIGVQPEKSNAMALSYHNKQLIPIESPASIADGLNVKRPGNIPFSMIRRLVDEVVTVPEEAIMHAMLLYLERAKQLVEGAGAVSLAAILGGFVDVRGKRTVAIVSGGNVDLTRIGALAQLQANHK
ncbi:threonine ammonia-lyase [Paenibacillus sp. MBLB4367]|uniref:threonine ammonia-lyase n=1 Tax=Paenibacillus sp. MBLB4367 TaxID=3384767 RepID=UPI0039081F4B